MPISAESHPLSPEQAATFDQVLRDDPQYREKLDAAVAAASSFSRYCGSSRST
ncbi:hypothetical protein [Alcanivorax sp. HI0033]|uniref:hypothetical protein n=1 Tax=Alcanivorax sp. HI0033 TaxID=1822228 RepID=UPI000A7BF092|nr:hypothetical protein [Alcanivorax sp. HI0033]